MLWAGHGGLPGADGWVSLHLADTAPLTLPDHGELELDADHEAVLDVLAGGGAYFFRQLATAVGSSDDKALSAALWDLVWAGHVGNDTLAPLRALTRGGRGAHRVSGPPPGCAATGRSAHRRRPPGRAARRRRSLVPAARAARPTRPGGRTPRPRACSSGTAWSPAGP